MGLRGRRNKRSRKIIIIILNENKMKTKFKTFQDIYTVLKEANERWEKEAKEKEKDNTYKKAYMLECPEFITDFNGITRKITDIQKSLTTSPFHYKKMMDDYGNAYLDDCVMVNHKCGCEIIGNGTVDFPLSIKFCKNHYYLSIYDNTPTQIK